MINNLIHWKKFYFLIILLLLDFYGLKITAQTNIEIDDESDFSLQAFIEVQPDKRIGSINPDIYGLFMEMCFNEFNGGIWAEMLKSRKFAGNDGEDEYYGVVKPWYPIGKNNKTAFRHDNSIFYCGRQSQKIISDNESEHRCGIGQGGLYIENSKNYDVRLNIRQEGIQGKIRIALEGKEGIYGAQVLEADPDIWQRFELSLNSIATDRDASITITFQGSGKLWVGSVSMMSGENMSGFRKDVVLALKEMKPPNIRWPGGNMVSEYDWEDGIGDQDLRPPRFIRGLWEPNDVGIDEFMTLCRLIGTKPYIAVNSGDGSPQDAANLVEYCNGKNNTSYGRKRADNGHPQPYNIRLWGIGNEMYGNWQNGHVDEETYARRHLSFARAMRSVDKDIKLVAVGGRPWKYPDWNRAMCNISAGYFDYLSLHSYAKKYRRHMKKYDLKDPDFAREFYYYIVSAPHGIEEQITITFHELQKSLSPGNDVKIAFDEWNCWAYRAPYELVDFSLRDGLYTAGVLHAFRRQNKAVTLGNFSKVVNALSMIRVNGPDLFFNPQYLVFKMYINHSGPHLIKSTVNCDDYPAPEYEKGRELAIGNIPYVDVSATISEDEDTLYLAVINRHIAKSLHVAIRLKHWEPRQKGKRISLAGEDYMTENTFEFPERIKIEEEDFKNVTSSMDIIIPRHSVTIFEFYKGPEKI